MLRCQLLMDVDCYYASLQELPTADHFDFKDKVCLLWDDQMGVETFMRK
jgi:hypothetical protein